jgi:DNA-binding MarR family transcriptional regulator
MVDNRTIRAIELLILQGGAIIGPSAGTPPEVRELSLAQYRALDFVAAAPDGLRISELARRRYTRGPQSASKIVRRLEERGLVQVERGTQADRRAAVVRLTETGERIWSDLSAQRRQLLADVLADTALPAEAGPVLEAVAAAIERHTA